MIDWENLGPLPRRHRETDGRERLARASLAKTSAKHKGRNHWRNWERRLMAAEARRAAERAVAQRKAGFERYCEDVRAYWSGARADHPAKP